LILGADYEIEFSPPDLADLMRRSRMYELRRSFMIFALVAVDQPTLVPNETGCRPVDRVAASVVGYIGGGVQPANRSKKLRFGETAPFWPPGFCLVRNCWLSLAHKASQALDHDRGPDVWLHDCT
jgi:hypothetical protein